MGQTNPGKAVHICVIECVILNSTAPTVKVLINYSIINSLCYTILGAHQRNFSVTSLVVNFNGFVEEVGHL